MIVSQAERVSAFPETCRNCERVDFCAAPPVTLVATTMKFPMMEPADGDGESVAHLASHGLWFCELDVVSIRRASSTDETGLGGNKSQMIAVALAYGLRDDGHRLARRLTPCRGMILPVVPGSLRGGFPLVKPN